MAKIFVSFFNNIEDPNNPQAMPCFYEGFLQELVKNGNDVLCYSNKKWGEDFGKPPKSFLDKIEEFNPDLIILFNNCCYDLTPYFDCPIIIWEADSYLYYSNKDVIKNNPDRFKFIVSQSCEEKDIVDYFDLKKKNVFYFPFSTAIRAENLDKTTNISFIGTNYQYSRLSKEFFLKYPTTEEMDVYVSLLKRVEKNPFINDDLLFKTEKNISEKVKDNFDIKTFIGDISAQNRVQTLSNIADLGLNIYGSRSWMNIPYHKELGISYKSKQVYSIKHNQDIYNHTKLSININHIQATTGFSWRVCDVMASSSCLVTEPRSDLKKLFPEINFPLFNNKYEAREVCKKMLNDKNARKEIINLSNMAIEKNHRFIHRLKELEQIIGIKLIEIYNCSGTLTFIIEKSNLLKLKSLFRNKFFIKTKLAGYGVMLAINQIPLINKPLMNRDEIIKRILAAIEFEETNKN